MQKLSLYLLTALLALTMDRTGLPLPLQTATDCVGCNELLPSRVDRGDHARFEEVRVDEGGWTSIVVVRTGNDPERLITFGSPAEIGVPLFKFKVLTD